jgi:bile acid:Na+ symporter, BASS family
MGSRPLSYLSNICIALGFLIPLTASKFIGMPIGKMPVVTASNIVLWAVGIVLAYLAFMRKRKIPAASPLWIKISGFVASDPSLFLMLGLFFGYVFYPSVEKSAVADLQVQFLMISLFVMGLAINPQDWKRIIKNPRVVAIAIVVRWLCMPLVAYLVSYIVFIQFLPVATAKTLAIGMIILGASPTGTGSNTFTMISRGDLALSVSVTTINTLIAPFLQPLFILWLAGSVANVNATAIFKDLLQIVIIPVALGSILGSLFPKFLNRMKPALVPIAVICMGLIILGSIAKGTSTLIKQLYILIYIVVALVMYGMIGLSIGYFVPKFFGFNLKQRKAACFEVGVENVSLAMTIAMRHFSPLAALVSILYGKIQMLLAVAIFIPKFQKMEEEAAVAEKKTPPPELAASPGG